MENDRFEPNPHVIATAQKPLHTVTFLIRCRHLLAAPSRLDKAEVAGSSPASPM
jgi:hypothetical protein